ncbi:MAG TPA: DUF4232 domain-containing protein [Acidimicrobiales bacterium]|nr:DUF4232 domain-containing protein [Acidimicrobiales bacterium]
MRVLKSTIAAAALLGGVVVMSAATAQAATPNCTSPQIKVSLGMSNGAAGTIYYAIVFTNTGGTCVLWGVPPVQPVTGSAHTAVGPRAANASMGEMPARHTLRQGQSVHDGYGVTETGNYPVSMCHPKRAAGIVVSLPGFVSAHYLSLAISVCTSRASTHTMLLSPGRGA